MQITPDTLPDYHFLFIAPNLGAEWLFDAAREYWERFNPTIISDGALLEILPVSDTIIVSLLTQRDAFRVMAVEIASKREDAFLDALVYDDLENARLALTNRAINNQPFGVPLAPTAIPPTREPLTPTPGAIQLPGVPTATPNMSGFITQTPVSSSAESATPTLTSTPPADTDDNPNQPINPTSGAITGG